MSPRSAATALVVVLRTWDPGIVASAERRAGLPPGALDRAAFADTATLRAVVTGRISDARWRAGIAARLVPSTVRPGPCGRSTGGSSPSSASSAAPVPWRC